MEQSKIGNLWLKQGEKRGEAKGVLKQARASLTGILEAKFPGESNAAIVARIRRETNVETLSHWLMLAATTNTFKKFVAAIEANGSPK